MSDKKYKIPKVNSLQAQYGNKNVKGVKILGVSTNHKDKKYTIEVKYNNKVKKLNFGAKSYDHYYDQWKKYNKKNHLDKERRKSYIARSSGILDGSGKPTQNNPFSANFWSIRILW